MKKQPEITETTRRKIIDSFWTLFQKMQIGKITINRISVEAGIHRSTFYRYYSDIYAVLEDFEQRVLSTICAEIEAIKKENTGKDLKAYINKTAIILAAHAEPLHRLLNSGSGEKLKTQLLENLQRNMLDMFEAANPDFQENLDYYVTFIGTMMLMNLNYWYEHQETYTVQEVHAKGWALVEAGIMKLRH